MDEIIKIVRIVRKKRLIRLHMQQITIIIREDAVEPYSCGRQSNHNQWQGRRV